MAEAYTIEAGKSVAGLTIPGKVKDGDEEIQVDTLNVVGTAQNTIVGNGGTVNVEGGVAQTTTVNAGGIVNAKGDGETVNLNELTVNNDGIVYLSVNGGAVAKNVSINSGGSMEIQSLTTLSNATVVSGGFLYVSSGGRVVNTVVSSGGLINEFTLSKYLGHKDVYDERVEITQAFVSSGHVGTLYYYQTALDIDVLSGGGMKVEERAVASSVQIFEGGSALVWEREGMIKDVYVERGATISAVSMGIIQDADIYGEGQVSGGYANNATIQNGGTLFVEEYRNDDITVAGSASDTELLAGAEMTVRSGGFGVNTQIKGGALLTISNAGFVSASIISANGNLVLSGGRALETEVQADGLMVVSNGGTISRTLVRADGNVLISKGGIGLDDTVENQGKIRVSSGGIASRTQINAGGRVEIVAGGLTESVFLNNNGELQVAAGGLASGTYLYAGGDLDIANGGEVKGTFVDNGALLETTNGAIINSTTVLNGGTLHVRNGGTHKGSIDIQGGVVRVYAGGIIDFTVSERSAQLVSQQTAFINNVALIEGDALENYTITVSDSQEEGTYLLGENTAGIFTDGASVILKVEDSSVQTAIQVNGNDAVSLDVDNDGKADYQYKLMRDPNGTLSLAVGDFEKPDAATFTTTENIVDNVVKSVTVEAAFDLETDGRQYYSTDNVNWTPYTGPVTVTQNHTTVYFKSQDPFGLESETASAYVYSIVKPDKVNIYLGGIIMDGKIPKETILRDSYYTYNNAAHSTAVNNIGTYYGGISPEKMMSIEVLPNGTAEDITIDVNMGLWVAGGTANHITLNNYAYMEVSNDGRAEDILVMPHAHLLVSNGGVTDRTTVNSKGRVEVLSGGKALNNVINNGGTLDVKESGYASGANIYGAYADNGFLRLFAGGKAESINVNSCGLLLVSQGGVAGNTTVNALGEMIISAGGSAVGITLENDGQVRVLDSGIASSTVIKDGGLMQVFSGGSAIFNSVYAGGHLELNQEAVCYKTSVFAGGQVFVSAGAAANDNDLLQYGAILVSAGGAANWTNIQADGGLHIYSGGTANSTTVRQGGFLGVGNGGVANETRMEVLSELTVWGGGVINSTYIDRNAAVILSSGAVAKTNKINAYGGLHVYSGAVAECNAVSAGGFLGVGDGGVIRDTFIDEAGCLIIWGGGKADINKIASNGALVLSSGAAAASTTIMKGGGFHIYAGATANNTTVTSGAYLGLGGVNGFAPGAILVDSELEFGGSLTCYDGASLLGWHDFGGTVKVTGSVNAMNSKIALNITERIPADDVIIDDLSNLFGATFFLTLDCNTLQEDRYFLAGGADSFNDRITLTNSTSSLSIGSSTLFEGWSLTLGVDEQGILYMDAKEAAPAASLAAGLEESSLGSWDNAELSASAELTGTEETELYKAALAIA